MSIKDSEELISKLRDPETGCPWDIEQTHASLAKYLLEESNEVIEAIEELNVSKTYDDLKEELGDVLLQVLLHSQLASEKGKFNISDVIDTLNEKLVRRHPHVFGNSDASTVEEVEAQWQKIKEQEQNGKNQND